MYLSKQIVCCLLVPLCGNHVFYVRLSFEYESARMIFRKKAEFPLDIILMLVLQKNSLDSTRCGAVVNGEQLTQKEK